MPFGETLTDMPEGLGNIQSDRSPLKIKEKSYSIDTPPSDMPT